MLRVIWHLAVTLALTVLTQLGGVAWLISLLFRRKLTVFITAYALLWIMAVGVAPLMGRVPLGCADRGALQMQSWFYCLANRNYVAPELADMVGDLAADMEAQFPGTITLVLDGSFPFIAGFPLLPHLSHDDGRKLDLAFYYRDESGYLPGKTRSPLGYFAFEDGPTACPSDPAGLRWDMGWLQPFLPAYSPDEERMTAMLTWLARDERVGRIFIEPHLTERYGLASAKVGFQGCHAARHDDHVHIQL